MRGGDFISPVARFFCSPTAAMVEGTNTMEVAMNHTQISFQLVSAHPIQ